MPAPPNLGDTMPALRVWHGAALFAIALAVFLLLPQRGLHGIDGNTFVVWIEEGNTEGYARHAAYLHLCSWIYAALEPFGAGGHVALRVASALGSALGLVFLWLAFRRLMPRHISSAILPAVAVLATPACFYFATTAEIAGVFAAGSGLAWWTFARWLDRPGLPQAIALGTSCAIAGALHALGHLMTPALLLVALLLRRLPANGRWSQLAAVLATHAIVAVLLSLLLARGASGQAADAASVLREYWQTFAPLTTPAVFLREWLLPYLPWSIGAFAALLNQRSRPFGLATLAMLALYLPPNVVFLGFHGIRESGAYFIALAPIAVLATAHFVTARGFRLAILASAIVTVSSVSSGWRDPVPPGFGAGVEALNAEHKIALIVANKAELSGARTAVKGLMAMELPAVVGAYIQMSASAPQFAQWFDGWHDNLATHGMTTVFSDSARNFFAETSDPQLGPFWREHLPSRYVVTEVERAGFRGVSIRPR